MLFTDEDSSVCYSALYLNIFKIRANTWNECK